MRKQEVSALLIGRFQPFHIGHLEVIKTISRQCDRLIVGIGSAQLSHTFENPFTAGERHLMINRALHDEGLDNYFLVPMVDINRYAVWVAHVQSLVPPFQDVYTNNPLTRRLFEEAGYNVRSAPLFNREVYSGTEIRKRIISGKEWEHLVPKGVAETIIEVGGDQRLRDLTREHSYEVTI
ncbi:MAG TPA: nicotinamide-nucleotide adenylyltransferase [Methanomassiliicoccaceae archaeon]|jgi:nicotinamide-nucleotide adenylyltransferase|nr:nicotinamide-nucleotide adenylyltransferase [Euryarchaeota archaeon]HOB37838.1 nicotinamide-nucleotide adenylyltransferase [Methanomassiliicoccaceae archaeon]HOL07183.1 nicotinamide-nucleotide adenylyltransferase [Methanomassiliicoccaceae archaeon]HOQ25207.1 nicotinamide-nucleotide adenylyltransferase [Methanomassiliicoccaceae archaeon]HPP44916.1 nicotinamide-nucleotide adenylyltransferase [Methanomassiliicoccaceae archaeon]